MKFGCLTWSLLLAPFAATMAIVAIGLPQDNNVERVIDGDTFVLKDETRIRVWGINSPERGRDYYYQAGEALERIVEGGVTCETVDTDRYKRIVARCSSATERDIGRAMVEQGWARDYERYSRGEYSREQQRAERRGIGMWRECHTELACR